MKGALKNLLDKRYKISTQLYLSIGAAASLTVIASVVAWVSFAFVGEVQNRVNEGTVPFLASAFETAQKSSALVAAAPRLAAVVNPDNLDQIATEVANDQEAFETALAALIRQGVNEEISLRIKKLGDVLIENLRAIKQLVLQRFDLTDQRDTLQLQLTWVRKELNNVMVPAIDDQLFYAMTGYRKIDEAPVPREKHFSEEGINLYRYIAGLRSDATIATQLFATAFSVLDAALLEPLSERFEATVRGIRRRLAALGEVPVRTALEPLFEQMIELSIGEDGGFNLRAGELELERKQSELLAFHESLEAKILAATETLVSTARKSARQATQDSAQAVSTGGNILLALSAISFVGAVLIGWLFIGRVLSRRLGRLSDRMRRMADGDLEEKVDIGGQDEVAEMAAALEIFRRHALEVQRLNLVEKLAEEIKGKNEELESALGDLEKAQDQIVMREKLAALGELTAGVAHEIRNPLNFIKNFSEVSEELMEELMGELEKVAQLGGNGQENGQETDKEEKKKDEEDPIEIINEIGEDLTGNLKRIREHGERANNIVESMLQMGRGSGEAQPTNINTLLEEHARLAYHSARAADPNFNLTIDWDLDPDMVECEVIPQDLGRVFLNMVSNASYATDERRKSHAASAAEDAPRYDPTLRLFTRCRPDGIEIRIRDNGSGMPPEVVEKIFNPFFTTKPTDKGTGLGLSLSSDIIRQHGGSIRVETEPDEFTEMIIELPR